MLARWWQKVNHGLTYVLLLAVRGYQVFLSRFLGNSCKYYPSCSCYAQQALKKYGLKGIWLVLKRLVSCNPWSKGGIDELP